MSYHSGRHPKVGLFIAASETGMDGGTPRWSDIEAMAHAAEGVGFDSLWLADRLLVEAGGSKVGLWESTTMLSALAASTSRVEIGTLVMRAIYRNPALVAKMVDSIDEISGGRFILGIGAGSNEGDNQTFGYAKDHLVSRFEESLGIIHGLLRQGSMDFEGAYYQVRGAELRPRGPRSEGPPIMIPAKGPRMMSLSARYADLWNDFLFYRRNHPDELAKAQASLDAACDDIGRDPASLERTAAVAVALNGKMEAAQYGLTEPITGSTDEIVKALRGFADAGISHLQVWVHPNSVAGIEKFSSVLEALDQMN